MLYTGKGDDGTTTSLGSPERVSKSSALAEALGNLDELNSYLGLVKVKSRDAGYSLGEKSFHDLAESVQQNIFIISASLAGAANVLPEGRVHEMEDIIAAAEKELGPITTFTLAGGSEISAHFDVARTLARRAERRVVSVKNEGTDVSPDMLQYLNRLSSLLFALARLSNLRSGIKESAPSYT